MNLLDLFNRSLTLRAGDTALEWTGREFTFGDLDRRSNQLAHVLSARGLRPGDRLGLYLDNRIEFIDVFLACLKLGVIVVPMNVLYQEREISPMVSDAEPKALIAAGPVPGGRAAWDVTELTNAATDQPGDALHTPISAGTPAAIVYTSGTTGTAKGAVLSHGNFCANTTSLIDAWGISPTDRSRYDVALQAVVARDHDDRHALPCP